MGSKVLKQFLPLGGQMPLDRYLLIVDCFFLVGQDKFMVAGHYPFLQGYVLTLVDGQILAFIQQFEELLLIAFLLPQQHQLLL